MMMGTTPTPHEVAAAHARLRVVLTRITEEDVAAVLSVAVEDLRPLLQALQQSPMTLKTDSQTYQSVHPQMLPLAISPGLLFHSAHEVGGEVGVVDFWPSPEAFRNFAEGPMAEGIKAAGIAAPDDIKITPVLNADSR
jgi:hypothetical protein